MKKTLHAAFAALAVISACQKSEPAVPEAPDTLKARVETVETKTYMDANNNIRWSSGDQVVAFMKTSLGLKYQILSSSVGKVSASFEKVSGDDGNLNAGTEWDHNVVFYPYAFASECEMSGSNYVAEVCLPEVQSYAEGSFGNGAMPMAAVSEDNDITFRNICGGMKLQLRGTQKVASITLEGKNSERLSGAATVTAYPGETKPAITMSSGASTSVTLDCGEGVQLNESKATEFIIALPPVLFSQGFTVTVTDTDSKTYTVETDKANTVLRSSLLVMPDLNLETSIGGDTDNDDEEIVPVSKVTINDGSLTLTTRFSYTLTAQITPIDATNQSVVWSSDNTSVATVDQSGVLTTLSSGTAVISAVAGGVIGKCTVKVIAQTTREVKEYKVDGVSYGKGIVIGDVIWAPVNCGYEPATSDSKGYPCGKLYQWGRKYGQGYSTDYDASEPEIVEGPISAVNGQKDKYSNTFFTASESPYDWTSPQDDDLWNCGTEENPIKTEYDPCPNGWRVPTNAELDKLNNNYSIKMTVGNHVGYYLSGDYTYFDNVPRVFFPAAGFRECSDGDACDRAYLNYWSSTTSGNSAYYLVINQAHKTLNNWRARALSVRCVQE